MALYCHFCLERVYLAVFALSFYVQRLPIVGAQDTAFDQLSTEQLVQILSGELQREDGRGPESLLKFDEFQDISEIDCAGRLVYLANSTLTTLDRMRSYHMDIMGVGGMYMKLLQTVPEENTWLWMLTGAHERLVQQVSTYWSRVVMLSLDKHACLLPNVKDIILDNIIHWKKFYGDLMGLKWSGFAFGAYSDATNTVHDMPGVVNEASLGGNLSDTFVSGNMWLTTVREWFEHYTQRLGQAVMMVQYDTSQVEEDGAARLHHQDEQGPFVTYEFLRRKVFKQWAIDKGLLRGLIRHVWKPPLGSSAPVTLGDFGAGGGHYSSWLNETGLIHAFAFDGTHQVNELTDGVVQEVNLVADMQLWRSFNWVMCLEVGEHIPAQYSSALLRNLKRHALQGLVMSWSEDWEGIGHVNCLARDKFISFVESETGFRFDHDATEAVRKSCEIDYIARTIAVFRAVA